MESSVSVVLKLPVDPFPSLLITVEGISAQGTFAEAQARYLSPDVSKVAELVYVLKAKQIRVVAHFYMDPEVQGVLVATKQQWPHIHISDSLVMGTLHVAVHSKFRGFTNS